MPGGDRTGPDGRGPMTGRAFGYCAGYNNPGFTKAMPRGRGYGRGFGRGWGRGRRFWDREYYQEPHYEPAYPEPSKEEEKRYLEDSIKSLEADLKEMKKRLENIDK